MEVRGVCIMSKYFTCCFHLYWKQPVTNFPLYQFTGPYTIYRCSLLLKYRSEQCECTREGKLCQRVKVVIPLRQGVTVPLSCRVFINPLSYGLISSSNPTAVTCCYLWDCEADFQRLSENQMSISQQVMSPGPARGQRSEEGTICNNSGGPLHHLKTSSERAPNFNLAKCRDVWL